MKIALLFAWYDFWIGLFWDKKKKWLYIFPVPMFGIILKFDSSTVCQTNKFKPRRKKTNLFKVFMLMLAILLLMCLFHWLGIIQATNVSGID